jgi:hypothetical protein
VRPDSAARAGDTGACRPLCTSDSHCSPNACNRRTGACERATAGDAFGKAGCSNRWRLPRRTPWPPRRCFPSPWYRC